MAGALAGRTVEKEFEKGRIGVTKVKRYWPGRAPEWAEEEEEEDNDDDNNNNNEKEVKIEHRETAPPVVVLKNDPRLNRLSKKNEVSEATHRKCVIQENKDFPILKEEIKVDKPEDDQKENIEQNLEVQSNKRAELRKKLLETRVDELGVLPEEDEDEEDENELNESESDYESDSEEEGRNGHRLQKPIFVDKESRETIEERIKLEKQEEREWEALKQKMEQRKLETKAIVIEKIRQEEAAIRNRKATLKEAADIDTDDDKDEEKEFESWKRREMLRIKRDKDEKLTAEKIAEEREKIKNMTEEERRLFEKMNPKVVQKAPKKRWKFLQKYWHKGAFFQENPDDVRGTAGTDDIYMRDFSDPTGEDKFDKSLLPKIMQVKDFGRSGRTKWTHLLNEDTTNFDDPWAVNDPMRMKYNRKMAASEQEFIKPKKHKT